MMWCNLPKQIILSGSMIIKCAFGSILHPRMSGRHFLNRKDSIQGKKEKKIPVIADSVSLPFKKTDIYKPYLCWIA